MKNYTITLLLLPIFCVSIYGQTIIKGQLLDAQSEPLSYANVLLLEATDSTLIKGTVTDDAGLYTLKNIDKGNYLLSFEMIGYEKHLQQILAADEMVDLVSYQMKETVAQLDAVEVTAKKPLFEYQIDRMVVNVQNSITSAGGTALEILEKSPGIIINRQSNAISMAGKDGVVVMINGKPSRMPANALIQMLQGMPAGSIEKIELISTPPANFDAEGDAGYINIVLKRNTNEGANGSITLVGGYGKGEKYGGNANINYRSGKLSWFADYGFMFDRTPQIFKNFRSVETNGDLLSTSTVSKRKSTQRDHNYRLGFDYNLTENTVLGGLFSGYDNRWEMDAFNEIEISRNTNLDTLLGIQNDEINHWEHLMGNLNLQHTFRGDAVLNLDADYLYYYDNNPTSYNNEYQSGTGEFLYEEQVQVGKETPIHIAVAKADFTKDWGDGVKLSAGLKGTISRFDNDVSVENIENGIRITDADLTQKYDLEESIAAAYSSFNFKISPKNSISVGLRYEYTDSYLSSEEEAGIVDREYGNLFPSLYISRDINENNRLQFSYSRRIRRPTFNDMAPFVIFLDPNTFFSGNPALQPSISDIVKADYRYRGYFLSVQYSYDDEAIANFQPTVDPETNKQFIAAQNLDYRRTVNVSLTLPFNPTNWWEMQANISGNWQENRAFINGEGTTFDQKSFSVFSSQSFKLPKDIGLEISGYYYSPIIFGITKSEPFGALNAGLEKKLPNDMGTLRFNVQDILQTSAWRSTANIPENNILINASFRFQNRNFRLTYTKNFGNNKLKTARQRKGGSEDEQQRVN
jgi:outer membrane receptor protein involved in Fe transport